ncbi:hypothetical protein ACFXPS_06260 [Nocardia sp. NPDC059091]
MPLDKSVNSMVAAIEREAVRASVPEWPWRVLGSVMPLLPRAIMARMS